MMLPSSTDIVTSPRFLLMTFSIVAVIVIYTVVAIVKVVKNKEAGEDVKKLVIKKVCKGIALLVLLLLLIILLMIWIDSAANVPPELPNMIRETK